MGQVLKASRTTLAVASSPIWFLLTQVHFPPLLSIWFCATSPTEIKVKVGNNDLTTSHVELQITSIIRHKDFQRHTMNNDIALLLLAEPLRFNEMTMPICMPPQPAPPSWHECWVAGWGTTNSGM